MKEMEYNVNRMQDILDEGTFKGYNYKIINYGWHPCAYVEIPRGHRFYGVHYDNIVLDCHGGVTFSGERDFGDGEKYYIGWDYAHAWDFNGFSLRFEHNWEEGNHQWTTEEILEEVHNVIYQILEEDDYFAGGIRE